MNTKLLLLSIIILSLNTLQSHPVSDVAPSPDRATLMTTPAEIFADIPSSSYYVPKNSFPSTATRAVISRLNPATITLPAQK